ncbi:Hypothetical predicted protein [Lecanosticta acicola]|uniref:Uncharacterized protein n=1 Tax=Lecanosticta acicola TaxID=111012 RepID=A0AAI8Z924_9PEZI|nr:Hypothetical predicted protein [Lecanosticta acicola]
MATPSTEAEPSACFLLDLPGELRNRIWRLAVVEEKPVHVVQLTAASKERDASRESPKFKAPPPQPALAATGKAIRHEVLSIHYGECVFLLAQIAYQKLGPAHVSRKLALWRKSLGDPTRLLRHARLEVYHRLWSPRAPDSYHNFEIKAHLEQNGEIVIRIDARIGTIFSWKDTQYCKCALQTLAKRSKGRGTDGGRLLDVMRAFCDDYTHVAVDVECKECQLPLLV